MNNNRTKRFKTIILTQSLIGLVMFSLGLSIVFFAQGYRLNAKTLKIEKTGVISLSGDKMDAEVKIDGKAVGEHLPLSKNLLKGNYDVEVKKDGYADWQINAKVEPELVNAYKYIVLFRLDIKGEKLQDERKIRLLNSPIDTLAVSSNKELSNNNYEIWIKDKLVTRFSKPILKAIWYPDTKHILYQQANQIRIIELGGTNDTLLVTLKQANPTNFSSNNKGDELYYIDEGEYKLAEIR